jgi:hypothetical protein
MPISPIKVRDLLKEKTAEYGKLSKKAIAAARDGDEFSPPSQLFISEKDLCEELNAVSSEDKLTVRQAAALYIAETNHACEAMGPNFNFLKTKTDIPEEEMKRAASFRESNYDMNEFNKSKSGCFIATATYDSPLSKEVIVLKKWRDQTLLNTSIGRNFVKFYYIFSPTIANYIRKSNFLKMIMLYILKPIIKLLK